MTPLPAETNWQEKLTNIANVVSQASYVTYKLIVNGQEITKMGQEEHAFSVTKVDETGETTVSLYPFIYTEEGIKMYEPLVVNGVEINNFKWDNCCFPLLLSVNTVGECIPGSLQRSEK